MVIFIVLEKNKVLLIIADPDPISAWLLEFLFFGERNRLCSCKIDNNNNKCFESRLWVINKRERARETERQRVNVVIRKKLHALINGPTGNRHSLHLLSYFSICNSVNGKWYTAQSINVEVNNFKQNAFTYCSFVYLLCTWIAPLLLNKKKTIAYWCSCLYRFHHSIVRQQSSLNW